MKENGDGNEDGYQFDPKKQAVLALWMSELHITLDLIWESNIKEQLGQFLAAMGDAEREAVRPDFLAHCRLMANPVGLRIMALIYRTSSDVSEEVLKAAGLEDNGRREPLIVAEIVTLLAEYFEDVGLGDMRPTDVALKGQVERTVNAMEVYGLITRRDKDKRSKYLHPADRLVALMGNYAIETYGQIRELSRRLRELGLDDDKIAEV